MEKMLEVIYAITIIIVTITFITCANIALYQQNEKINESLKLQERQVIALEKISEKGE